MRINAGLFPKCFFILIAAGFVISDSLFCQTEYQRAGSARKNSIGGYDFYDASGARTQYSKPNANGSYTFYNNEGNKIGNLRPADDSQKKFNYYDDEGIKRGTLKRAPSGIYYYQDLQSGAIVDSIPQTEGDLGSLSPEVFKGGR
ncbi:MAG: hypothetical protein NTY47_01320 [Candidatus Omnitrophica bacterium]|nr:hypothetical protein [Candidatus Omnitrophota bacterium]